MIIQFAPSNAYVEAGYKDRIDYLKSLAEEYEIDFQEVLIIANCLGQSEDFDGLISAIQDYADYDCY